MNAHANVRPNDLFFQHYLFWWFLDFCSSISFLFFGKQSIFKWKKNPNAYNQINNLNALRNEDNLPLHEFEDDDEDDDDEEYEEEEEEEGGEEEEMDGGEEQEMDVRKFFFYSPNRHKTIFPASGHLTYSHLQSLFFLFYFCFFPYFLRNNWCEKKTDYASATTLHLFWEGSIRIQCFQWYPRRGKNIFGKNRYLALYFHSIVWRLWPIAFCCSCNDSRF